MYFIHIYAGIEPAIPIHLAYSIDTREIKRERKKEREREREKDQER